MKLLLRIGLYLAVTLIGGWYLNWSTPFTIGFFVGGALLIALHLDDEIRALRHLIEEVRK